MDKVLRSPEDKRSTAEKFRAAARSVGLGAIEAKKSHNQAQARDTGGESSSSSSSSPNAKGRVAHVEAGSNESKGSAATADGATSLLASQSFGGGGGPHGTGRPRLPRQPGSPKTGRRGLRRSSTHAAGPRGVSMGAYAGRVGAGTPGHAGAGGGLIRPASKESMTSTGARAPRGMGRAR